MMNKSIEQIATRLLTFGAPFVTVFLIAGPVSDPVNITKLLALGILGFALGALFLTPGVKALWQSYRLLLISFALFIILSISAIINSDSPITQNFYGTYGRNTGFIAYLSLIFVAIGALFLREKKNFERVVQGLLAAGVINVLYCLWAWQVSDFVKWNNPYNRILGTFGNPNFIGAFLGIYVSISAAYLLQPKTKNVYRVFGVILIAVAFLEIEETLAVQGVVVSGGGLALVLFYFLRSRFKSWLIPAVYSCGVSVVGFIAIMGALQKGPLADQIYKTSVSLRGEYWHAAWVMASKRPLTGVGMDSYGDWYRRARDESAMILPGPDVITNAAHSVPFDILAFGGWPLFISYLAILTLAIVAIIRVTIRSRTYDGVFVALAVGWVCYQVQSLISINQIGLAIWGWLLSGAVIAYEFSTRGDKPLETETVSKGRHGKSTVKSGSTEVFSPALIASLGAIVGLMIALPPYSADAKLQAAIKSGRVVDIEKALTPTYLTPSDSFRYANTVLLFEQNKLTDLAYKYALIGIDFNPDYFDAWKVLYGLSKATAEDKARAKTEMIRLDPLNEAWKKLP